VSTTSGWLSGPSTRWCTSCPELSAVSILAGTLAAYGAVAVLLAIAGGIAAAVNSGTDFSNVAWTQLKAGTGVIVAVVLLVSYFFGGYVSGRMARRSGVANGIGVFVLGVIIALVVGVLVKQAGGGSSITSALRNVGAPTTWHEWRDVGTIAGIAALVAMLLGAIAGGSFGDRWHTKLLARALDPAIGPEAEIARQAAVQAEEADAAHLAAEHRVARSTGRTLDPDATTAAGAAPVVAARRDRTEQRLAEERTGLATPAATEKAVTDERAAADERAVASDKRVAPGERIAAEERATADERAPEADRDMAASGARPMADQRVGAGEPVSSRNGNSNGSRRLRDRLLHR
jgi:hypothetical protein